MLLDFPGSRITSLMYTFMYYLVPVILYFDRKCIEISVKGHSEDKPKVFLNGRKKEQLHPTGDKQLGLVA